MQSLSNQLASVYEASLEPFSPYVQRLINQYPNEYDTYRLDEVVVAAIDPLVRRLARTWKPLEDPVGFLEVFREWRRALKINVNPEPTIQVDVYGNRTIQAAPSLYVFPSPCGLKPC